MSTSVPNPPKIQILALHHAHFALAPEIFREPPDPNWKLRVIEKLFPALSRNLEYPVGQNGDSSSELGVWGRVVPGLGVHDVVIETPIHSVLLSDLNPSEIGDVFIAYKRRIEQIKGCESIKYVQVFKNHGASAWASMSHSHSQILSLRIVLPSVSVLLDSMKEYFNQTGKCSLCEVHSKDLLINETNHFTSIAPFAASFPFEIWIIRRDHSSHFYELDNEKAVDLGGLLKLILRKISLQLNNPPFNFMIHTSPLQVIDSELPYNHWFFTDSSSINWCREVLNLDLNVT